MSLSRPRRTAPSRVQRPPILASATAASWTDAVLADFDHFLIDHAACERKASAMAVSMICHYPDRPALIMPMADLAVEEMGHYREVIKLIEARGVTLTKDEKDPYVNALRSLMRTDSDGFLQDRLLVAGLIEARGTERFSLLAEHLREPALCDFYARLARSEARHYQMFFDLADRFFAAARNGARLADLRVEEARILEALPARAALH